jgi:hypothetical protein
MVLFGFILVVSVAALLGAQKLDIECNNPPQPQPRRRAAPVPQKSGFPAESMGLRRI